MLIANSVQKIIDSKLVRQHYKGDGEFESIKNKANGIIFAKNDSLILN